jgi:hypothetical protein
MVYVTIVNVHAPIVRLFPPHCARRKPIFVISSWHVVETVVAAFNLLPQELVVFGSVVELGHGVAQTIWPP